MERAKILDCPYNNIPDPNRLMIGQLILIPGATGQAVTVQPRHLYHRGALPDGALQGTAEYVWPTEGYITQRFGKGHPALDIAYPLGTPILAADSGFVVQSVWEDGGYGNCIIIDHGNGVKTRYAHLSAFHVSAGESVTKGQIIGAMGASGRATGSHLHFEVQVQGVCQNPLDHLPPR